MKILFCLIFIFIISSCQNDRVKSNNHIILSSQITGIEADALVLKTDSRFYWHHQETAEKTINLEQDQSFTDTLDIPAGNYEMTIGDRIIKVFLKPGYDLNFRIEEGNVTFSGKGEKENTYIKEREVLIAKVGGKNFYHYFSNLPEDEFLAYASSLENERLNLINNHVEIDEDLRKTELAWAKVEKAQKFLNYSFTREKIDALYIPSPSYPDPLEELDINDEIYLNVSLFPFLLYSYFANIANKTNLEIWEYILNDSFPVTNEEIREEIFFTTAKFSMQRFIKLDEFYSRAQEFLKSEEYREEITAIYQVLKELETGSEAPAFELKNMEDELVALKDFCGNLIYIDFWASWCKPCLEDLPDFKKLQEKFKSEEVKFVSIGMESKKENLLKIINDHQLNNIHLFDPEQEQDLKKNYSINGIPRYVLIDREGKIIDHNAKRPSNPELVSQLQNLLN
jgi:thiol-disulfide isomerase/thioredoxin